MKPTIGKLKKKSPTYWRKKCVDDAKLKAKIRDKWCCQKCGKKVEGQNAHGSHILNEGAYPLMSAEKDNILCMCYHCHIQWWHKCPHDASEWFDKKWPGRIKILRAMNEEKKKHLINWEQRWKETNPSIIFRDK
jgi:hypothetical protein